MICLGTSGVKIFCKMTMQLTSMRACIDETFIGNAELRWRKTKPREDLFQKILERVFGNVSKEGPALTWGKIKTTIGRSFCAFLGSKQ